MSKAEAKLLKAPGTCSVTTATECYADGDCPTGETCSKALEDSEKYTATVARCQSKFNDKLESLTDKAFAAGDPCPDGLAASEIQDAVDEHVAQVAAGLAGEELSICGDGDTDVGEDCDLGNLNGGTCSGEGFAGGVLRCGAGCVYDTSACSADRFVDNANGTITDNDTGLKWEKKVKLDSTSDLANRQDADNLYPWSGTCSIGGADCQPDAASAAACLAGVEGNNTGCAPCVSGVCNVDEPGVTVWQWLVALNGAGFAGHNDWRLAQRQELQSIADYGDDTPPAVNVAFHGASCGEACTDVNDPACACTQSDFLHYYWSASTYAPNPDFAWTVGFFDGGYVDGFSKSEFNYVRAVRGGS